MPRDVRLPVSLSPCLPVSLSPCLPVSLSPCLPVTEHPWHLPVHKPYAAVFFLARGRIASLLSITFGQPTVAATVGLVVAARTAAGSQGDLGSGRFDGLAPLCNAPTMQTRAKAPNSHNDDRRAQVEKAGFIANALRPADLSAGRNVCLIRSLDKHTRAYSVTVTLVITSGAPITAPFAPLPNLIWSTTSMPSVTCPTTVY